MKPKPQSKPQVMWAMRHPSGSICGHYFDFAKKDVEARLNKIAHDWWPMLVKQGWRIVKVEIREVGAK